MLREKNLVVDEAKFEELMNEQKNRAKASWKGSGDKVASGDFKIYLKNLEKIALWVMKKQNVKPPF